MLLCIMKKKKKKNTLFAFACRAALPPADPVQQDSVEVSRDNKLNPDWFISPEKVVY